MSRRKGSFDKARIEEEKQRIGRYQPFSNNKRMMIRLPSTRIQDPELIGRKPMKPHSRGVGKKLEAGRKEGK